MKKNKQSDPVGQVQSSRFFSCLLVMGVFLIIDLAILAFFFWPSSGNDKKQAPVPAIEKVQTAPGQSGSEARE